MRGLILILALCIASSMAISNSKGNKFLALNANPYAQDLLNELKGTKLGSSISTLIQLKMKAGTGNDYEDYEDLFYAFDNLRKWLNAERNFAERKKVSSVQSFNTQKTLLSGSLADNDKELAILGQSARVYNQQIDTTKQAKESADEAIQSFSEMKQMLETTRSTQVKAYNDERPKILAAINGIEQALVVLDRVDASSQVLLQQDQKESFSANVQNSIKSLSLIDSCNKQRTMLKSLLSLAQEFTDQEALATVIGLLEDLRDQLTERLNNLDSQETDNKTSYESNIQSVDSSIQQNTQVSEDSGVKLGQLQDGLQEVSIKIGQLQEVKQALNEELSRLNQGHDDLMASQNVRISRIDKELALLDRAELILSQEGINREF